MRRVFPDAAVIGIDRDDVTLVAGSWARSPSAAATWPALADADLVVLAAPVTQNLAVLARLGEIVRGPALVTDVGSTKRATVEAVARPPAGVDLHRRASRWPDPRVAVSRPRGSICSSDVRGCSRQTRPRRRSRVERLASFVRALGATPVVVDPVMHDHVLAYTSHLPQLTASALMHVVGESVGEAGLRLSGSGLADTTRVAASPAPIWSDICATNADEVLPALDRLIATLQTLRGQLAQDESIAPLFESAQRWRARLK